MKKSHRQPTHRPPLTDHEKIWLFAVAIRSPAVFDEARQLIQDEHFFDTERWLLLIWRVTTDFYTETGELPSKKLIFTRCNAELKLNPDCLEEGGEERINKFLTTAFRLIEEDMNAIAAVQALRKFLEDRLVANAHASLSMPQTPLRLAEAFAGLQADALRAASIGRCTLLPDDLNIICHPPDRNGRCHVVARIGDLAHEHYFQPLDQYQRELFCEKAIVKLGLTSRAQHELEERVLIEARRGVAEHATATITSIVDVESEPIDWLWRPRIAYGTITLLVGPPEKGKSTIALDIAARLSRGRAMPVSSASQRERPIGPRVARPQSIASLLLVAEDSVRSTIRPRLSAARADIRLVHRLETMRIGDELERPPQLPTDIPVIERQMIVRGARLLVVDVLGCFLADGMSLNDDADMRRTLTALKDMAERINAAILVILHLNKKAGMGVLDRIAGSTAIGAAARTVLFAAQDPSDSERFVLATAKNNLDSHRESLAYRIAERHVEGVHTSQIVWEGLSTLSAAELLESGNNGPTKLQQAEVIIMRMLASGQNGASEILNACLAAGISERTFYAARRQLGVTSERDGFGVDGRHVLYFGRDNGQPQLDGP